MLKAHQLIHGQCKPKSQTRLICPFTPDMAALQESRVSWFTLILGAEISTCMSLLRRCQHHAGFVHGQILLFDVITHA